jgi:ABC-2 type transport system permease protein
MSGPLGYLATRSTRNRLRRQLRRLRTPRYAIALILGLGYLWAVGVWNRPPSDSPDVSPETVQLLGSVGVLLVLLWSWIFGADRRALAFSRAEVTWLFPAPLLRRQLIQYKLLRGQFIILFNVVLWTFLLSRGWAGGEPWRRAGSIWILLTTLSLHRLGVALFRSGLAEHGRAAIRTRWVTLLLLAVIAGVLLVDSAHALPVLRAAWDLGIKEFLAASREIATRPVPSTVLLPFRWLVGPLAADTWAAWGSAMLPACALLVAHFFWVVRSDAAFEESAAAAALARGSARRRPGGTPRFTARPVPRLRAAGRPGTALLWKNLAAVVRTGRVRSSLIGFIVASVVVAALSVIGVGATLLEIGGWFAVLWAGFLLILGPQWIRNDLRTDLARLAVLRSYPLRGRTVVAAETAGSTAVLTGLQLGLVLIAYVAFWGGKVDDPPAELRTAVLLAAVVLLPGINFLAMLIQNGSALLFPAWVRVGQDRPIGVEALGHNMLAMSGFLLVLGLLLLLPAAVAGALYLGLEPAWGWWAAAPAGAAAIAVAAAEGHLLLARLGRVFEATDPSSVAPTESP